MKPPIGILVFVLLFLGFKGNAQKIDLSLSFNKQSKKYEVFARPNFTKEGFLISAGSQITLLLPAELENKKIVPHSVAGGDWLDHNPTFNPTAFPAYDLHTFISQGGAIDFEEGKAKHLFSITLPIQYDLKTIRLFANDIENKLVEERGNFIANEISLTDFYNKNYNISKNINGTIKDWRGYPMEGVKIEVGNQKAVSLYDGRFEFKDVEVENNTRFQFKKDINTTTGISLSDLILLQRHLSGVAPFDRPYQWIAGDIDNSGMINQKDADLLQQILDGSHKVEEWRFMLTSEYEKIDNQAKKLPQQISINKAERSFAASFIAIKVGDLDGSFTLQPQVATNILPSAQTLTFNLLNIEMEANKKYTIPFSTLDIDKIEACQMSIQSKNAQITNLIKEGKELQIENPKKGLLTLKWLNPKMGKKVRLIKNDKTNHQSAKTMLNLELVPNRKGKLSDFITLLKNPLPTEAYDKEGKKVTVQILFQVPPEQEGQMELYQNRPNPFKEYTHINYHLPKDGQVKLTLFDESGQVLKSYEEMGKEGFNSFQISGRNLAKGVIYYELVSKSGTSKKKMVHLN